MIEKALLLVGIAVALLLAASAVGDTLTKTFARAGDGLNTTVADCSVHQKDTCSNAH